MKITFRKMLAAGCGAAGFALIAVGGVLMLPWLLVAGFGLLTFCLLAVSAMLYRHTVFLLARSEDILQKTMRLRRVADKHGQLLESIQRDQQSTDWKMTSQERTLREGLRELGQTLRQELTRMDEPLRSGLAQIETAVKSRPDKQEQLLTQGRNTWDLLDGLRTQMGTMQSIPARLEAGLKQVEETVLAAGGRVEASVQSAGSKVEDHFQTQRQWLVGAIRDGNVESAREIKARTELVTILRQEQIDMDRDTAGWSATTLLALIGELKRQKPGLVLDCGSDQPALWLAKLLDRDAATRMVMLDHRGPVVSMAREQVQAAGLPRLEVRWAPLVAHQIDGQAQRWYDDIQLSGLDQVELLIVHAQAEASAYPALPLLKDSLAPSATIVVRDCTQELADALVDQWRAAGFQLDVPASLGGSVFAIRCETPQAGAFINESVQGIAPHDSVRKVVGIRSEY